MKTRTDFVSNSSSSSFILKDAGFFKYFGITKQDILDAIIDLYGGKEHLDKLLKQAIEHNEKSLEAAKTAKKKDNWDIKYYTERLEELKTKGLNVFCVYDMKDKKDREACYKEWDDYFARWWAPAEGECSKWEDLLHLLRWQCDFDNVEKVANGEADALVTVKYNRKSDKHIRRKFSDGVKLVRHMKEKLGIKSMKEVLHDKHCTLMIHFSDNEVYGIKGMTDPGKGDDRHCCSDSERAKAANAEWDSESYSADRFFEILIKYFIAKGRVNLSDPKLLDYWTVGDNDSWFKKDYPDKKTYLEDDSKAGWHDVLHDMLNCNAVMHEG